MGENREAPLWHMKAFKYTMRISTSQSFLWLKSGEIQIFLFVQAAFPVGGPTRRPPLRPLAAGFFYAHVTNQ